MIYFFQGNTDIFTQIFNNLFSDIKAKIISQAKWTQLRLANQGWEFHYISQYHTINSGGGLGFGLGLGGWAV